MEISINDINTYQLPLNCFQSHYKIIQYLGEGSFGKVFKAREISTGKIIAVKKMSINNSEKKYSNIIKEINLLKHLDHPNIVKYYDYFKEEDYIYLMMEYLDGGTLKEYIRNKQENITENEARIIIKQLLTAISYLHYTCDICHRDIKPENIMFTNKNDINELKLLDFGLSSDSFESKKCLDNCGTLIYMAPEQLNKMIYSKAVDVWSVGIILYMLLNKGKNPFYNKGEAQEITIKNISNNNIIYSSDFPVSHMGKHLINKLLKKNPSHRYTIRSALDHPWITMNKFDKIPMTIYDKAFFDEYAEKLKTLWLSAIFFSYQKKYNFIVSKNNKNIAKNNKIKKKSNSTYFLSENRNKKIKNLVPKRKNSENTLKIFNMNEYEKMVKDSNLIYKQKFKEDREIMFNPKLTINYNNNELLLSSLIKRINEKQKTRQCSFLIETKTNINYKDNKYESMNSLENSYIKQKKLKINKNKNNKLFIDEQKNNENDGEQDQKKLSKLKTPFKIKNNKDLLDNNTKDEIPEYKQRSKLIRRFSAIPRIRQKNNNINKNKEESKITAFYKGTKTNDRKLKNKNSYVKNYIDCSKKEIEKNEKSDKYERNDYNIFKKQLEYKKKKFKTKSVKNTNVYFLDKSTLIDNKEKKWKMNYNKDKDKENKKIKEFPLMKRKEIIEKSLFDANLFMNNETKDNYFLNNDKKNKMLSFTEQSQKNPQKLFNKKYPQIFYNKKKINNLYSQI